MATLIGSSSDDFITDYFVSAGVFVSPVGSFTTAAADSIDGGAGDDLIDGSGGADTIFGGDGNDSIAVEDGYAFSVNGGAGYDTLSILIGPSQNAYNLNLAAIGFEDVNTGALNDTIDASGVILNEVSLAVRIDAGGGNDSVIGSRYGDYIYAYSGNDTIFGGDGADFINGGSGQCSIDAGAGDRDYVLVSTGYIAVNGGAGIFDKLEAVGGTASRYIQVAASGFEDITLGDGNDTIDASSITINTFYNFLSGWGNDSISGSKFNDGIYGGDGADTLIGGDGDDSINTQYNSAKGADSILAGSGNDYVAVSADFAFVDGGEGFDTLDLDATVGVSINLLNVHFERVEGGAGNDTLDGSTQTVSVALNGWSGNDSLWGSAQSDTLVGGDGNDTIIGGDGNDTMTGSAGADVLNGGFGADTFASTQGADTFSGGAGADIVVLSIGSGGGHHFTDFTHGSDKIDLTGRSLKLTDLVITATTDGAQISTGGDAIIVDGVLPEAIDESDFLGLLPANAPTSGNDTLVGSGGSDSINALAGDDAVSGLAGNDTLLGLSGADTLTGDDGNDSLDGGIGIDRLIGGLGNDAYIIDSASDVIVEDPNGGVDLIGSSVSCSLQANVEKLTLMGNQAINGTGNELDNVLAGNAAVNTLSGLDGNDSLNGGGGNDTLLGGSGNDTLTGAAGADSMAGNAGDDVYSVDNTGDIVTESGFGTDRVETTVSFTLGANIENLTLKGTAAINGTGNELGNVINGNAAVNTLLGLDGNDSLNGGGGNDSLLGAAGDDTLDGGSGADAMNAGAGNDLYRVDNLADTVNDSGSGIDSVESTVSFSLSANVENLSLKGTAAINGMGNDLANVLVGNASANALSGFDGADSLSGGGGNDVLLGGAGSDTLSGGTGYDRFDYNTAAESKAGALLRDVLTAFDGAGTAAGDIIDLSDVFAGALAFVAAGGAFSGVGQVRVAEDGTGNSLVQVNLDANTATSEMEILIVDAARSATVYSAADFIL